MDFIKVMVLCLSAVFLCVFFSQYKKEYAAIIAVSVGCIALIPLFKELVTPLNYLVDILNSGGISSKYFSVALKAVALGYVTQFVSETCRDFGCGSVATKAELAGKISIFLICLPMISELFEVITELI